MKAIKNTLKKGNLRVLGVLRATNLIFCISGGVLACMGAWMWSEFKAFTSILLVFIICGAASIFQAIAVFRARGEIQKLRLQFYFISVILVVQALMVIICQTVGKKLVKRVAESISLTDKARIAQMESMLYFSMNMCILSMAVTAFQLLLLYFYVGSLSSRSFQLDYQALPKKMNSDHQQMAEQFRKHKETQIVQRKSLQAYENNNFEQESPRKQRDDLTQNLI